MMIQLIQDKNEKETICRSILHALPDWFGISESIEEYATGCRTMPLLDECNPCQLYVMAVK